LEYLVAILTKYTEILKEIDDLEKEKEETNRLLSNCEQNIVEKLQRRTSLLEQLRQYLDTIDQTKTKIKDIKFSTECTLMTNDVEKVTQKVNVRDKTDFVDTTNHSLKITTIREQPANFLSAVYNGSQKINTGNAKKEVVKEILTLTENILFAAEMEGDKIGGISETTMTPGRRALFLLRLILAESNDTWPLLIDQPEDNLDSRSISNEIVPFLKQKKKQRQIILVSHNANLVIGADSEQIIVANRNGSDRPNEDGKQFNYFTGSIENSKEKDNIITDTLKSQGIREHACEILDGGKEAFELRRNKYNLTKI
jgi:DNA repair exonuclease SbcCD ATPase subunit